MSRSVPLLKVAFGALLLLASVAAITGLFPSDGQRTEATGVASAGDVNCDGTTNSIDAAVILQYAAGLLPALACQEAADTNHDTHIDAIDAALILQFSAGLLTSLVPGVTNTEIILGAHTSLTGPIAAYNIIPKVTKAYFDHINTTDSGVNGRKITYLEKDDQYSPAKAVDLTHELVQRDHIFAMFNALGTPNHLDVIDYLQANGVPDMFVATGATEWVSSPSARPLTFGSSPNYTGEGLALGKWILDHKAANIKVGVLYENDDFGQEGLAGVRLALGANVVGEESYEVTAPDLNSQIDRLRAANADVIVSFATPLLLGIGIRHARLDLGWNVQFVVSSVGMNELTALITGPANFEGTFGPVTTYMTYQTSIPGVQANHDLVTSLGQAPSVLTLYAQYVAEMMVETLKRAGRDLTREGLVKAAESIRDWKCSVCLFPVTLGPNDHDPAQSVAIGVYQSGRIVITDAGYSWEGVSVADLGLETIKEIAVPADAQSGS